MLFIVVIVIAEYIQNIHIIIIMLLHRRCRRLIAIGLFWVMAMMVNRGNADDGDDAYLSRLVLEGPRFRSGSISESLRERLRYDFIDCSDFTNSTYENTLTYSDANRLVHQIESQQLDRWEFKWFTTSEEANDCKNWFEDYFDKSQQIVHLYVRGQTEVDVSIISTGSGSSQSHWSTWWDTRVRQQYLNEIGDPDDEDGYMGLIGWSNYSDNIVDNDNYIDKLGGEWKWLIPLTHTTRITNETLDQWEAELTPAIADSNDRPIHSLHKSLRLVWIDHEPNSESEHWLTTMRLEWSDLHLDDHRWWFRKYTQFPLQLSTVDGGGGGVFTFPPFDRLTALRAWSEFKYLVNPLPHIGGDGGSGDNSPPPLAVPPLEVQSWQISPKYQNSDVFATTNYQLAWKFTFGFATTQSIRYHLQQWCALSMMQARILVRRKLLYGLEIQVLTDEPIHQWDDVCVCQRKMLEVGVEMVIIPSGYGGDHLKPVLDNVNCGTIHGDRFNHCLCLMKNGGQTWIDQQIMLTCLEDSPRKWQELDSFLPPLHPIQQFAKTVNTSVLAKERNLHKYTINGITATISSVEGLFLKYLKLFTASLQEGDDDSSETIDVNLFSKSSPPLWTLYFFKHQSEERGSDNQTISNDVALLRQSNTFQACIGGSGGGGGDNNEKITTNGDYLFIGWSSTKSSPMIPECLRTENWSEFGWSFVSFPPATPPPPPPPPDDSSQSKEMTMFISVHGNVATTKPPPPLPISINRDKDSFLNSNWVHNVTNEIQTWIGLGTMADFRLYSLWHHTNLFMVDDTTRNLPVSRGSIREDGSIGLVAFGGHHWQKDPPVLSTTSLDTINDDDLSTGDGGGKYHTLSDFWNSKDAPVKTVLFAILFLTCVFVCIIAYFGTKIKDYHQRQNGNNYKALQNENGDDTNNNGGNGGDAGGGNETSSLIEKLDNEMIPMNGESISLSQIHVPSVSGGGGGGGLFDDDDDDINTSDDSSSSSGDDNNSRKSFGMKRIASLNYMKQKKPPTPIPPPRPPPPPSPPPPPLPHIL